MSEPESNDSSKGQTSGHQIMRHLSGDELARRVAATLRAREPTSEAWDIQLKEARPGYSRVQMRIRADMLNGHGSAHGGIIFALADTAFAYACNSGNIATVAAQASILFLSAVHEGEVLIAEAQELATAGRSGGYAVHVKTDEGRAVAEFLGLSRTIGGPDINPDDEEEQYG
jgi:acyl-CoA thioesterase